MELFTLLAKLTLDSSAFDSKLEEARSAGKSFHGPEDASLDLDTSPFDSALSDAEQSAAGFTGPKGQTLDLDTDDFDTDLSGAQTDSDNFSGPAEQELDLDASGFDDNLDDAQTDADNFEGPADQTLDLDTSDFNTAVDGAETTAGNLETSLDGTWKKIAAGVTAAGVIATINKVRDAIAEAVNLAATMGDDVDKGSRRLGISAEAYQEWGHALSQSGANINDFQRGILSMNKLLADGSASEEMTGALQKLGVSTKDANDKLKTTETFLKDTVKALAEFNGTSAERGALVQAIFGRSGNNLNALLDSGSSGIQDLIDEAHNLGLVMSDDEIANSVAYGDALANLHSAVDALKTKLVEGIVPELTTALQFATDIVSKLNGRTDNSLESQLAGVDAGLAATAAGADETARTATGLLGRLWEMGDATKLTADQQALWHATAKELVKLIPELSEKVNLDTLELTGNKKELQGIIDKWADLTKARALSSAQQKRDQILVEATEKQLEAQVAATLAAIEADKRREDALAAVNKEREKLGMPLLRENASEEEIAEGLRQTDQSLFSRSFFDADYNAADAAVGAMNSTKDAAEKAAQEADTLTQKVADTKAENVAWMEAMEEAMFGSVEAGEAAKESLDGVIADVEALKQQSAISIDVSTKPLISGFHAKGADIIPYDNYPAILHRDEAVLTASDARKWRAGQDQQPYNAAAMEEAIISAIRKGMEGATVEAYMDGKRVTQQVNRQNTSDLQSRRYAP